MESTEEFEAAIARLSERPAAELALFIAQLALRTGPVGEHARTFILADQPEALSIHLSHRIARLEDDRPDQRNTDRHGHDLARRLDDIVSTIESALLAQHPLHALDLLVQLLHRDGALLEASTDHDDDIAFSLQQVDQMIAALSQHLDPTQALQRLASLAAEDAYGTRQAVTTAFLAITTQTRRDQRS